MSQQHDDDAIEALLRKQFDGPVPNEGFSERVMQRLPPRRRRMAWPLWAGIFVGTGACWLSLSSAPLLRAGWRDWMGGELSAPAITLLLVIAGMSLLASWWSVTEADDR
jgi:hypothetical protein